MKGNDRTQGPPSVREAPLARPRRSRGFTAVAWPVLPFFALGSILVGTETAAAQSEEERTATEQSADGRTAEGSAPLRADSAEAILRRFAEDYEKDPSLKTDVVFGVSLGREGTWHVVARAAGEGRPAEVVVRPGEPSVPTFSFSLHHPTLVKIDRGEINASTAMARGLASDPALMSTSSSEGFEITPETIETLLGVSFHFWTRGFPEVVPFGDRYARTLHGADAVILHYRPGFRSGWFSLKKGQHANADPRLQTNPFPTLLVITGGRGRGRIGGEELELGADNAVLIPAGVTHEFWNPYDEPVEGFILMFGKGA